VSDLSIVTYGSKVLRKRAEDVKVVTPALKRLADDMLEAMYAASGVGLAAPQVGESVRLFVLDVSRDENKKEPMVFFNPRIVTSRGSATAEEGCLSIPDVWAEVTRPQIITVHALDREGKPFEVKDADGLLARCIQHEYDHLEGVLFTDKISATDRMLNESRLRKLTKSSSRTAL
jgi:peptide deformylase